MVFPLSPYSCTESSVCKGLKFSARHVKGNLRKYHYGVVVHRQDSRRDVTEGNQVGNDDKGRASIWSVRTQDRPQFSYIFFGLFSLGLGFVSFYEVWVKCDDTWAETAIALIRDVGMVGLASVILALIRFEGGDTMGVALDIWREQRARKHTELYEKGIAEGRRLEREESRNSQSSTTTGTRDSSDSSPQQR